MASARASIGDEPAVAQPPSERLSKSSVPAASASICLIGIGIVSVIIAGQLCSSYEAGPGDGWEG